MNYDHITVISNETITADFQGWGTSLAWWAEYIGTFDAHTRIQFLSMVYDQYSNESLRFNIGRFNLGGGTLNMHLFLSSTHFRKWHVTWTRLWTISGNPIDDKSR